MKKIGLKSFRLPCIEVSKNENFKNRNYRKSKPGRKKYEKHNKEGQKKAFHGFSTVKLERSEQ